MRSQTRQVGRRTQAAPGPERQMVVWVVALFVYALIAWALLTRITLPSPLHLVVLIMAAGILVVTALRIEWGVFGLALILPFSRPGFTIGELGEFHISGFNVALIGVFLAYGLRYFLDDSFAARGPFIRRTKVDAVLLILGGLLVFSTLAAFNMNETALQRTYLGLAIKKHVLLIMWFYLVVSVLKTPSDLRGFVTMFAVAGVTASFFGVAERLAGGGAQITAGTQSEQLAAGAGGRLGGGWFGLNHPNMFGGLLLLTLPFWFFMVNSLKRTWRRLLTEIAVVTGFLGLLFTYSRSAWIGALAGLGLVGLADRRSLQRLIIFGIVFAVIAQGAVFFTTGRSLIDVIISRFEQLEESAFSSRPHIYASAGAVVAAHPWLGVGLGTFRYHAPPTATGFVPQHAHNVFYHYAAEAGVPAAAALTAFILVLAYLAKRNLRIVGKSSEYAFLALGSAAALIGIVAQMMVVQVLHQEILAFAIFTAAAVIVALDRMADEGHFDASHSAAPEHTAGPRIRG